MKKEQKVYKGFDVYENDYGYDEVKVIAMLHKELVDKDMYPDWEDVMCVGHWIYGIWKDQQNSTYKEMMVDLLKENPWMNIRGREEEGYVQVWFARRADKFIEYFKNNLR